MGAAGRGKAQPCGRCQGSAAPRLSAAWVNRRESSRGASTRWWGHWPPLSCPCRGVGTRVTWGHACQPPSRRKGASGTWFLKPERGSSGRWAPSPLLRRSRVCTRGDTWETLFKPEQSLELRLHPQPSTGALFAFHAH